MIGSIAAGLVAALVAGGPAAAYPGEGGLACGSVISTDTTLRADVTCTPEEEAAGLAALTVTVTTSPLVLDLGGHTVRGNIRVNGVYSEDAGVTVRNGTALRITAWDILSLGVTGVRLTEMTIYNSQVTVSRSELDGRGTGSVRYEDGSASYLGSAFLWDGDTSSFRLRNTTGQRPV